MKITVLKKTEYKGYKIFIMNFGNVFQYLFSNKEGDIFQNHVTLRRNIINIIKCKLSLLKIPYTLDQQDFAEEVLLSGAFKSIDLLEKKDTDTE